MHEPLKDRLEEYLRGGSSLPEVEAHLRSCESCRVEVNGMRAQNRLFDALRSPLGTEPDPGFYARVTNRVETGRKPSVWNLFGESMFARRLGYASAAFLVLLGTFLVSSTSDPVENLAASSPEIILAGDESEVPPPIEVNPAQRGAVLVNLATYHQGFQ